MEKKKVTESKKKDTKNTTKSVRVRAWDVTTKINIVLRNYYSDDQMTILKPLIQSYSLDVVLLHDFKKRLSADVITEMQITKHGLKKVVSADFKAYQELLKNLRADIDQFKALFKEGENKDDKKSRDLDHFLNDFDERGDDNSTA